MTAPRIMDEDEYDEKRDTSRKKMYSAERAAYMKPMLKLKQQEKIIERGLFLAIENMKIDPDLLQSISYDVTEISEKRKTFLDTLYKKLEDITSEFKSVKHAVEDAEEISKLDVNIYKLRLKKLSEKMQDFKKIYSTETLSDEKILLESELNEFEANLRKYESLIPTKMTIFQSVSRNKDDKGIINNYEESQDFHALVSRTGHTENWSEEDHLLFLRMRKKCNGIVALINAIQTKCPDISKETIVNHEAWYKVYLELREKQKSLVQEWRRKKETERSKKIQALAENVDEFPRIEKSQEMQPKRERSVARVKKEMPRVDGKDANKREDTNAVKRNQTKQLIERWKTEKENKCSMDAEQLRIQTELKREMKERQRRLRLKAIQDSLCEYKSNKLLEVSLKESTESRKEKCKADPMLLKAFRQQDKEFAMKRKELVSRLGKSNETKETRKHGPRKPNECSTLFNATKGWNEKCKLLNGPIKGSDQLQYIKDVPKLCTRWRNEESADLKINLMYN